MEFDLKAHLEEERRVIEAELRRWLPQPETPTAPLFEAMEYSLMAGGKRLRPVLMRGAARAVSGDPDLVLPAACAMEFIHTYSLIHDDLPAMDDDDLRRGRPTCHKVFGEAMAILAGDALLTLAFEIMSAPWPREPALSARRRATELLARAAGPLGMVGGQVGDILFEGREIDLELLRFIHRRKTGALITAALVMGGVLAGAREGDLERLERYGRAVGHAFQIVDDILDVEGDEEEMGKRVGSDEARGKATYPALMGLEESRRRARELVEEAKEAVAPFGAAAAPLAAMADYIVTRRR